MVSPGGLDLQYAQFEQVQDWVLKECQVLYVFKGNGLLDTEKCPLAVDQMPVGQLAFQVLVVQSADPLPCPKQPDQQQRYAKNGDEHDESNVKEYVGFDPGTELGSPDRFWGIHSEVL
jgi:hypothetical protein